MSTERREPQIDRRAESRRMRRILDNILENNIFLKIIEEAAQDENVLAQFKEDPKRHLERRGLGVPDQVKIKFGDEHPLSVSLSIIWEGGIEEGGEEYGVDFGVPKREAQIDRLVRARSKRLGRQLRALLDNDALHDALEESTKDHQVLEEFKADPKRYFKSKGIRIPTGVELEVTGGSFTCVKVCHTFCLWWACWPVCYWVCYYTWRQIQEMLFMAWYNEEKKDLSWLDGLLDCPCTIPIVDGKAITPDPKVWCDPIPADPNYHPGASWDMRSRVSSGAGQQCCYNDEGKLFTSGLSAGTPDKVSPYSDCAISLWSWPQHWLVDVVNFCRARDLDGGKLGDYLTLYFEVRPPNKGATASFEFDETQQVVLTIAVDGQGDIDPQPGTYKYDCGTQVTVTASPASGWSFAGWGGDASGVASPITITMDDKKEVTACFKKLMFRLSVVAEGIPEGIAPPQFDLSPFSGTYTYDGGTRVSITAPEGIPVTTTLLRELRFSHWGGDASGTSPRTIITMDSNKKVIAYYGPSEPKPPIYYPGPPTPPRA